MGNGNKYFYDLQDAGFSAPRGARAGEGRDQRYQWITRSSFKRAISLHVEATGNKVTNFD
jgi:hypothetical protein